MSSFWEWQSGIRNRNFFILEELIKRPEVSRVIMVNYLPWTFKRAVREFINSKLQFKIKNSENNRINQKSKISPVKIFSKNLDGQENQNENSKCKNIKENNLSVNCQSIIYRDLTSKLYQINEKLFVYSTVDSYFSKQKFIQKLTHLLSSKFQVPSSKFIVWSCYPLFIDYYTQIPSYLKIFDAIDDWRAHQAYVKQKDLLNTNYQRIKKQTDIIFTTSRYLKESLFEDQKNVYLISNGVDAQITNYKLQFKIDNNQPVIGYVGNIQNRIDFNLIKFLVQKNPDKLFVFVGKIWPEVYSAYREIKNFKNIQFIGPVLYSQIGSIISQFDLAIVPHKINELTKSMDPMKIYEYLSFGPPVISTAVISSVDFSNLVDIAKTYEEFNQKIDQNLNKKQSADFQQKALEFIRQNTWEKRVGEMMRIILMFK